jgi:threonylcarbamoyladenosine tRNA methylthiotransferase MtaB
MPLPQNVITFGCRLNAYESEVIKAALDQAGTSENTLVFNSCAVTKEAERQLRQSIRRHRKEHPEARIIVTGCAAQISPDKYASMKEVDRVLGNQEKFDARYYGQEEMPKALVNDIMSVTETASHMVASFEGKTRAFIQVQNGCNHRCTFCIIPYGRGNSRSVPIGEVVAQAKLLVEQGYKEVVLTGVDISDYGKDLPASPTLGQMMTRLLKLVPDLPRLRLSSIDVAEIDDELLSLIAHEPRFMPYLHISLQAGDDMILKRMKRRHTREQVIAFCEKARSLRPEITFGADIIAGFPTEDDTMFENTLKLVEEAGLHFLHVFPYSEREGTPAAKMPQLPLALRKSRAARLREAGEQQLAALHQSLIGKTLAVVVEQNNLARAENFVEVDLLEEAPVGMLTQCEVVGIKGGRLFGKVHRPSSVVHRGCVTTHYELPTTD